MAFQGAGQAMQPGLAYQLGSVKAVEKLMFDIYPIYDKSLSLTKTKEKKMGLDQYAHLRDQKDLSFNTYDDNYDPETLMSMLEYDSTNPCVAEEIKEKTYIEKVTSQIKYKQFYPNDMTEFY